MKSRAYQTTPTPVLDLLPSLLTTKTNRPLEAGAAPSYYIEGLLYNVPIDKFGSTYEASVMNCINWLWEADRSNFLCANAQYKLLDGNADVTWNTTNYNAPS